MPVEIRCDHRSLHVNMRRLGRYLRAILHELGRPSACVDVRLVGDRAIRGLNRQWRGINRSTDVLSFALNEAGGPDVDWLGDLVISLDAAQRQAAMVRESAREQGFPGRVVSRYRTTEETLFLATHGLLHLLGHDHQEPAQAEAMEALERHFMAAVTPLDVHAGDRTLHGLRQRDSRRG
jgi:probable rRNA maturation factor